MKYINEIFDLLLNEETYKQYGINNQAKYWKMGTSFFTMFDRLADNIKTLDISSPMKSIINENNLTTQGKNISYKFIMENINVTPCKVRGYVSQAAMHQYMRSIVSFGLGVVEQGYDNFKDFVENNGEIKLVHNIKELLEKDNRVNLIKKVINDAFFSNIADKRNIAYSIILEFLFQNGFNFNNLTNKNKIFCWNKSDKQGKKYASLVDDIEEIKKDIYLQGTIATYKEIIICLNEEYKTIESFIEDIWFEYQSKINNKNNYDEIKLQLERNNLLALINSERAKFKDNIFNNRKAQGLIETKNDLYTDIVDLNNDTNGLLAKFSEAEAAHLFDVYQIKREVLKDINNQEMTKYVSNPNNGLIMKHEYHKSLDRNQWSFDANGNMIVPVENQDYLFNVLRLKRIKINPIIFNEEMRIFLNKR